MLKSYKKQIISLQKKVDLQIEELYEKNKINFELNQQIKTLKKELSIPEREIEQKLKEEEKEQLGVLLKEGYPQHVLLLIKKHIKKKMITKKMKNIVEKLKEHESAKPQRMRMKTIKEIFSSEKVYLDSLRKVMKSFYHPLLNECEKAKPIISRQEVQDIFSTMEIICEMSQSFLNDLKNRMAENSFRFNVFGDVFLRLVPILKIYSFYIRNYEKGQQ